MILVFLLYTQIYRYLHLSPYKKIIGDIQNCNNYRGIKLLSDTMKVWDGGQGKDKEGCAYLREPIWVQVRASNCKSHTYYKEIVKSR